MLTGDCNYDLVQKQHQGKAQSFRSKDGPRIASLSTMCEKITEMFKYSVPQRKIGRDLDISSSTVHNIIKKYSRNLEEFQCVKDKDTSLC